MKDNGRRRNSKSLLQTKDQLLLLQAACSLLPIFNRATSFLSSSSPAVGIWCRTKRHMWWRRWVDVYWHRNVVMFFADVLHNVLALACERCLSHYSARKRVERYGKDQRPVVWEALSPVSLNTHFLHFDKLRILI